MSAFWCAGYIFTTTLMEEELSLWQHIIATVAWPMYLGKYVKNLK